MEIPRDLESPARVTGSPQEGNVWEAPFVEAVGALTGRVGPD